MSYQFSTVKSSGETRYFPLEFSRRALNSPGSDERDIYSRFVFLTDYSETFESVWHTPTTNFGALNPAHKFVATVRKLSMSFKLPARNVADSKNNLDFCQEIARMVYGRYTTAGDFTVGEGYPTYQYLGATFDTKINFGNLIRNETCVLTAFSFAPNFDAGVFEHSATAAETDSGEVPIGEYHDSLFSNGSANLPETSYVYHGQRGKVYPKEVTVEFSAIIFHDYPLGFGGPRRPGEPLKWAENENRDWPHGTGNSYPVPEYMTKDSIAQEIVEQTVETVVEEEEVEEPRTTDLGGGRSASYEIGPDGIPRIISD